MFKKILVAEDFDSINMAVIQLLESLNINEIHHAKYCDDVFQKFKKAQFDNAPFDLLISDLSFKSDFRTVKLKSGEELIEAIRKEQPNIKIIVYSIEEKPFRIKSLFENLEINAFVQKGRQSLEQLKIAIHSIESNNKPYISPELNYILQDNTIHEIDDYDIKLINLLSSGFSQEDIESQFKEQKVIPNSKSAIEKRINKLKIYFKANN